MCYCDNLPAKKKEIPTPDLGEYIRGTQNFPFHPGLLLNWHADSKRKVPVHSSPTLDPIMHYVKAIDIFQHSL
jgi:hypothetical protein